MASKWNDGYFLKLEKRLGNNLEKAAIFLKGKIKESLNIENPYWIGRGPKGIWYHGTEPSLPGEPPRKIRGDLQRSIAHKMEDNKTQALVGSNLDYALYLEMGTRIMHPRPFMRPALNNNADTISKIVLTGKK